MDELYSLTQQIPLMVATKSSRVPREDIVSSQVLEDTEIEVIWGSTKGQQCPT
jgi:hypothetical protein